MPLCLPFAAPHLATMLPFQQSSVAEAPAGPQSTWQLPGQHEGPPSVFPQQGVEFCPATSGQMQEVNPPGRAGVRSPLTWQAQSTAGPTGPVTQRPSVEFCPATSQELGLAAAHGGIGTTTTALAATLVAPDGGPFAVQGLLQPQEQEQQEQKHRPQPPQEQTPEQQWQSLNEWAVAEGLIPAPVPNPLSAPLQAAPFPSERTGSATAPPAAHQSEGGRPQSGTIQQPSSYGSAASAPVAVRLVEQRTGHQSSMGAGLRGVPGQQLERAGGAEVEEMLRVRMWELLTALVEAVAVDDEVRVRQGQDASLNQAG